MGVVFGVLAWLVWSRLFPPEPPEPKVITITEPAKIVYQPGPQPTPIIIEKIVVRDGDQVSFKQDIPFQDKQIAADSGKFRITYSGIYHISMENSLAAVSEEIVGDVAGYFVSPEHPSPRNELGPFYSTVTGAGVYYRRCLAPVKFGVTFQPWGEIRVPVAPANDLKRVELSVGMPVKF